MPGKRASENAWRYMTYPYVYRVVETADSLTQEDIAGVVEEVNLTTSDVAYDNGLAIGVHMPTAVVSVKTNVYIDMTPPNETLTNNWALYQTFTDTVPAVHLIQGIPPGKVKILAHTFTGGSVTITVMKGN